MDRCDHVSVRRPYLHETAGQFYARRHCPVTISEVGPKRVGRLRGSARQPGGVSSWG